MIASFESRLRQRRSRLLIRSWDYRQRNHARGVWLRLRRVLADASEAYAISEEEASELMAKGRRPEPVGRQLEPEKLIFFVPAERVARMAGARPLALRLDAELLAARYLVLVPFGDQAR